jgi:hypothetical protein
MIQTPSVSLHAAVIASDQAPYNSFVALITDL